MTDANEPGIVEGLTVVLFATAKLVWIWICVQTVLNGLFLWWLAYQVQFSGASVSYYPPDPTPQEFEQMMKSNRKKGIK